jgi:uncharacterized integral membrane protein (TIGR00697 family)
MPDTRNYTLITALFVAVLIISEVAATKIAAVGPFTLPGATFLFPLSYIFGDVLTEVYGYRASRRVVWTGFFCTALAALVFAIVGLLPPAPAWPGQEAYMAILGQTPRIVAASLLAYLFGEIANSFVLAKMKVYTDGKWLWTRTIGSTIVGELLDSAIFILVAFFGILPGSLLLTLIISNYVAKVAIEVVFTPVTYAIVGYLKRHDHSDVYDRETDFNPFKVA